MQAPNAQGLAGLMSRPQQQPQPQPQGPSPDKASPMAGLGSVEDRVSAYRGNPAPLQQRYAMSQDLLDLLALQKIKSEKEAAARQMQLSMGQQAAAQGAQPPTIAQQREKEVMDMTKAELAQQRGATADQQVAEQQQNMQRLMSGIARAPGAASAAQPVMMASGGIVAFDKGGSSEDPRRKRRENESFADYRRRMFDLDLQIQRERNAARTAEREAERQRRLAERGGEIIPPSPFLDRAPLPEPSRPAAAMPPTDDADFDAVAKQFEGARAVPGAPATPMPQPSPGATAAPTPMPAPAPRAAAPTAPGALAAPAAPGGTSTEGLGALLRGKSAEMLNIDPRARQLEEESRVEGRLAFPEEQERRRKVIDEQRRMYEQEFDPERLRREGLKRALIGAGGRRYGEFAGAATQGMAYDDAQRAARRDRLKGLEDMEQGLFGLRQASVKEGIGAGQKAGEQAGQSQRAGIEAGTRVYGTDTQSKDNALQREVERLRIAAQNEANTIQREGLNLSKAQTLYSTTMNRMQQLERSLDEDFASRNGMLLMAEQSGKMDKAQEQQLQIAREQLRQQKAQIRREMEPVLAPIRQQLGVTSAGNLSKEDQELVNRYLNQGQ
jgi:hypothetical protein